ncbi:hypothetical protein D8674_041489 [Pyrus ussuriensis x Pyrus communis]|uniref:Uncharacterized protein n=1 Tax=Pyrus ussuriensis x Pyrus communis TaxID=2448454 RepID=A0A5N5G937_9ROSA|nr:hypothetical protein D8674_041489 [Pyrus ussuriensis x Pyrus communis]
MKQVNHTIREKKQVGRKIKKKRQVRVIIQFNMATTPSSPFKRDILEFTRENSSLIFTKEVSQNYFECVNIKHSEANCYLKVGQKEDGWLIVATAHTPNEDKDDENCTLFTPEKPDILEQYGLDAALCAVSSKPDETGEVDVFTVNGS